MKESLDLETKRKKDAIRQIAISCKLNCPEGFANVSEFHSGIFDSIDFPTPWTIGAQNVNSKLMIVAQDWASTSWLSNPSNIKYAKLGHDPRLLTNKNIEFYLNLFGLTFADTYATNAFPYIKVGHLSARIKDKYFQVAIKECLLPQIKIIQPRMIICLGSQVYNGLRRTMGMKPISIKKGHEEEFDHCGIKLYGAFHPGGLGTANAGGKDAALEQWLILSEKYKNLI
jgi:hypothetical protein